MFRVQFSYWMAQTWNWKCRSVALLQLVFADLCYYQCNECSVLYMPFNSVIVSCCHRHRHCQLLSSSLSLLLLSSSLSLSVVVIVIVNCCHCHPLSYCCWCCCVCELEVLCGSGPRWCCLWTSQPRWERLLLMFIQGQPRSTGELYSLTLTTSEGSDTLQCVLYVMMTSTHLLTY